MKQDDKPNVQLEIREGRVSSPYPHFRFCPVKISNTAHITRENIVELGEEFSIEQSTVDVFLAYFLSKHFDGDLIYNKNRTGLNPTELYWCGQNFFTYKSVYAMLSEITKIADLFAADYDDPALAAIKEEIEVEFGYWDAPNTMLTGDPAIFNCRYILADFYRSFATRLSKMMENNPSTNLICVAGA